MAFTTSRVAVPKLVQAMSAGVWRFQAAMEQSSDHVRAPQKKNRHRGQER